MESLLKIPHPYRGLPPEQFWSTIEGCDGTRLFDPSFDVRFSFSSNQPVAVVGSCFVQRLGRHLVANNFSLFRTEGASAVDTNFLSANHDNLYTPKQLHQLFLRAYGLHVPSDNVWRDANARFVDPFRPQIKNSHSSTKSGMLCLQQKHLSAVRQLFEECLVLVVTLGLSEAWLADDGTVVPLPPGALSVSYAGSTYHFCNFGIVELIKDMSSFVNDIRGVNPNVKMILTVSPVPIAATYAPRNVVISNAYTKAALRVMAEEVRNRFD
jgi:GSCFA family